MNCKHNDLIVQRNYGHRWVTCTECNTDFLPADRRWPTLVEDIKRVLTEKGNRWTPVRFWAMLDRDGDLLIDEAEIRVPEKRVCPDAGVCHHSCETGCWRVANCGPLSGVYPGDEWPASVRS